MPKTHPTYDSGFRQEAVNLLISSQRPLKAVAAELGVSANSLSTWRDRAPAAEIRRLQRENEYLRRQR
jgi:transposase-like protein